MYFIKLQFPIANQISQGQYQGYLQEVPKPPPKPKSSANNRLLQMAGYIEEEETVPIVQPTISRLAEIVKLPEKSKEFFFLSILSLISIHE